MFVKDKTWGFGALPYDARIEVEILRIRIVKRQTIETSISEEALLLAKFLRNERENWKPRIASV
jgi:hypothetical protein